MAAIFLHSIKGSSKNVAATGTAALAAAITAAAAATVGGSSNAGSNVATFTSEQPLTTIAVADQSTKVMANRVSLGGTTIESDFLSLQFPSLALWSRVLHGGPTVYCAGEGAKEFALRALTPLDGRYGSRVKELSNYFSE